MQLKRAARSPHRKSLYIEGWLIITLMVFASVEIGGFAFLTLQRDRYGQLFFFDIDDYVDGLNLEEVRMRKRAAELKHVWAPDPSLGWRRTASSTHLFTETGTTINTDGDGVRVIPNVAGPVSIATYGDSFTEGLEVDDAETWQAHIAYATGTRVLNYGVSGYGPDQALLALEADLENGVRSPIVILAMINENLNRMMSTFRLFYTYPVEDVFLGFKPIFVQTDSGFTTKFFAPADITDVDALRGALWSASQYDWFYQYRTERRRFPFSLNAVTTISRHGIVPASIWPDYSMGLPRDRIEYILERFHDDSQQYGFTPVFVLLPESRSDLRNRGGRDHPLFSAVAGRASLPDLIYIDVVKELTDEGVEPYVQGLSPESFIGVTHPSVLGNRAIANVILAKLRGRLDVLGAPRPAP